MREFGRFRGSVSALVLITREGLRDLCIHDRTWYAPGMSTTQAAFGSPAALRRMIEGQERAARMARQAEKVLEPEAAFEAAMDLWSLCPELLRTPADAVRRREVEQVRAAWKKLKARANL